jgi:hypothetical protein
VRFFYIVAVLLGWAGEAVADTVPLPRPRPPEIGRSPAAAPEDDAQKSGDESQKAAAKKKDDPPPVSSCFARLRERAVIKQLPNINERSGCIAADVVLLEAVILPDDGKVAVEPPPTFRCEMAAAVTDWIREEIAPAVADKLGSPLRAVENFDSFSCRARNRVAGALLSEHGKANALDIRSLKLVDGTSARPTDPNIAKDFRDGMRKGACSRFKTVLGPGSDGYHEDHIHVDLAERRSDYRICQWDVRQPIHRALPSPHIVSETRPSHEAPASHPVSTGAAAANADEKPPRNTRLRRL